MLKNFQRLALLIFLLSGIQSHSFTLFARERDKTDEVLDEFIENIESKRTGLQGSIFAVVRDGKIVHKSAKGHCAIGDKKEITFDTMFPLASVSKAISALGIAKLVDEGKIDLEEEIDLPYFEKPYSICDVIGHTTGYSFTGNYEVEKGVKRDRVLKILQKKKPKCDHCYFYNNIVFSASEDILHRKGLSLRDAISALDNDDIRLYSDLGNRDIAFLHTYDQLKKEAYVKKHSYYQSEVTSAAGIYGSLNGLLKILKIISYEADIISRETLNKFLSKRTLIKNDSMTREIKKIYKDQEIESYYGLGWRKLKYKDITYIMHAGFISGMSSFIGFIPEHKTGIIFVHNGAINEESGKEVSKEIAGILKKLSN